MTRESMDAYREFLKDSIRMRTDFSQTDQNRGLAPPPMQKPYRDDQELISLTESNDWTSIAKVDLMDAIAHRRSHRRFQDVPLTVEELAFLLWATQGLRGSTHSGAAYRTVPSAGCRHTFETYLCVLNIQGH